MAAKPPLTIFLCLLFLNLRKIEKRKTRIEINKNTRDRIEKFSVSNGIKKT